MTATQTYTSILNAACMLPLWEQEKLIQELQDEIHQKTMKTLEEETATFDEVELIDRCVDASMKQIAEGKVLTQTEAMAKRKLFAETHLQRQVV